MNLDLSKIKKVFFIGVGGIGISALAKMAISKGMQVSGVNDDPSPKTLDPLRELGAEIFTKDDLKEVPLADLYVYSDAWPHRGPEIIQSAKDTGNPVMSYFEALGVFAKEYKVIAISGTHGKTTTTSMIAEMLVDAGFDPTVIVGSIMKRFGSNFREGNSEYLVVEADEYMKHFLNFYPWLTVITNIEADHLDVYKDLREIQDTFNILIDQTQNIVIYNPKDIGIQQDTRKTFVDYTKYLEKVPSLLVPGVHNRMNASCVLAVAEIMNISSEIAQKSLSQFLGTWKRLEKRLVTPEGVVIYDDYAHHPTEVRASLQGLRELYRDKKITVLFQPHLYSRTKALFADFVKAFGDADEVLFLPIYFAREAPDPTISSELLAEEVAKLGQESRALASFSEAEGYVKGLGLKEGDVFVTMGAGEAYKVADSVFHIK